MCLPDKVETKIPDSELAFLVTIILFIFSLDSPLPLTTPFVLRSAFSRTPTLSVSG